jgi:hypothetical protein
MNTTEEDKIRWRAHGRDRSLSSARKQDPKRATRQKGGTGHGAQTADQTPPSRTSKATPPARERRRRKLCRYSTSIRTLSHRAQGKSQVKKKKELSSEAKPRAVVSFSIRASKQQSLSACASLVAVVLAS